MKVQDSLNPNSKKRFRYVVIFSLIAVLGVVSVLFSNYLIENQTTQDSEASVIAKNRVSSLLLSSGSDFGSTPTACGFSTSNENIYIGMCDDGVTPIVSGLNFENLRIPKNSTISRALLNIPVDGPYSNKVLAEILVVEEFSKPLTVTSTDEILKQTFLPAKYIWKAEEVWTYSSTNPQIVNLDLKEVIQSVVKNSKWESGGDISIVIKTISGDGHRRFFAFDRENITQKVNLQIDYTTGGLNCGFCGLSCGPILDGVKCPQIAPPSGQECVAKGDKCVLIGAGTPIISNTQDLKCGYCGTACIPRNDKMMCPQVAPPAGKTCIQQGNGCVEIDSALTSKRCAWCGNECKDALVERLMCNKALPPSDKVCIYESGACVIKDASLVTIKPPLPVVTIPSDSRMIPQSSIVATASTFEPSEVPSRVLDANPGTLWHTNWDLSKALPQSITLDLQKMYNVDELWYMPRQDASSNGIITQYKVYISSDGQNFTQVSTGNWSQDRSVKKSVFAKTAARYIKLEALSGVGGWASAAELYVLGDLIETKLVFSPETSTFYDEISVSLSLSPADSSYKIYYKIGDGSEVEYTKAFKISQTSTISARATSQGKSTISSTKTYTKNSIALPTNLKSTCLNNGSVVRFEWTNSTSAEVKAYLVALYDSTNSKVLSKIVTTSFVEFSNIQATEKYSKWTIQPLLSDSDSSSNLNMTKNIKVDGAGFQCVIPAPDVPTIGKIPTMTNLFTVKLVGKKPAGASLLLNGNVIIGNTDSQDWAYDLQLNNTGENKFELWSKSNNKDSGKILITIHRCTFGDLNCDNKVDITDFSWFVKAMILSKNSDEKFEFMELADMNNGEGAKGDGSLDVKDFTFFRDVYIRNVNSQ